MVSGIAGRCQLAGTLFHFLPHMAHVQQVLFKTTTPEGKIVELKLHAVVPKSSLKIEKVSEEDEVARKKEFLDSALKFHSAHRRRLKRK